MTLSVFFMIAAMICLIGVVFSLFRGLFVMTQEGKEERVASNKMMRMRVLFQGLVLLFLFLAYLAK